MVRSLLSLENCCIAILDVLMVRRTQLDSFPLVYHTEELESLLLSIPSLASAMFFKCSYVLPGWVFKVWLWFNTSLILAHYWITISVTVFQNMNQQGVVFWALHWNSPYLMINSISLRVVGPKQSHILKQNTILKVLCNYASFKLPEYLMVALAVTVVWTVFQCPDHQDLVGRRDGKMGMTWFLRCKNRGHHAIALVSGRCDGLVVPCCLVELGVLTICF